MQTIVNLVSAGMGVAWVPASVTGLQRPGVVYRPVADADLRCETSLVWRTPAGPVVDRFVAHVQAQSPEPKASVQPQSAAGRPFAARPRSESS